MRFRRRLSDLLAPEGFVIEREERAVRKQEAERRSTLPPGLNRLVKQHDALPKPYDPLTLRDYSDNPIAQAYIDTLSQDAATASWHLEPVDENTQVSDQAIADAEETLRTMHPELSFRDIKEFLARDLLELGDATLVKHFDTAGNFAEGVPVDSSRMFKQIDDHGFTDGYIQTSFEEIAKRVEFDLSEVVWMSWAQGGRENYLYGYGPTEKGVPIIELLDELSDKELKDLKEGAPPGIVGARDSADNPIPPEEFNRVDAQWDLKEGQRHRHIISRGDWAFTPLSPGYQELQLLERSKFWIHSLGGVFKVNSPYAGFDFQEGNKAQNDSQAEAFRQRGFRVMLRYIEQGLNAQLMPDIDDRLRFRHDEARTVEERKARAELMDRQATAGKNLVDAGLKVSFRDDQLVVEDGEMESGSTDTDGGGFFGETGGIQFNARSVDKSTARLSMEKAIELDEWCLLAHQQQIQPSTIDDIEKRSWSGDESVPKFVQEAISEAIDAGAVFRHIESIPGDVVSIIEDIFEENMTQPQGWSLDSLVSDMSDAFPGVDQSALETVTRTESAGVLNSAREIGFENRDRASQFKYKWTGPSDSRETDACAFMKRGSSAVDSAPRQFDGTENTPLSMPDLKKLEREVTAFYFPNLTYRDDHVLHPNERHTFRRVVL